MNPIRMLRNLSTIKQDQSLLLRFFSQISHNSSETVATTVKISDGSTNKNNHDCFGSSKILVSRKYMSKAPNTYLVSRILINYNYIQCKKKVVGQKKSMLKTN